MGSNQRNRRYAIPPARRAPACFVTLERRVGRTHARVAGRGDRPGFDRSPRVVGSPLRGVGGVRGSTVAPGCRIRLLGDRSGPAEAAPTCSLATGWGLGHHGRPGRCEHHDGSHDRSDRSAGSQTIACHQAREEPPTNDPMRPVTRAICQRSTTESASSCATTRPRGRGRSWRGSASFPRPFLSSRHHLQPMLAASARRYSGPASAPVQPGRRKRYARDPRVRASRGGHIRGRTKRRSRLVRLRRCDVGHRERSTPSKLSAVLKKEYFAGGTLLYDNIQFWGWAWLIVGVVQVGAAIVLFSARAGAGDHLPRCPRWCRSHPSAPLPSGRSS